MCLLYNPHPSRRGLQGGGPDSDVGYQSMGPGLSDWLRDWFVTNLHQLESVPGLLLDMLKKKKKKGLAVFLGILRLWTVSPEQGGNGLLHHRGGRVPAREHSGQTGKQGRAAFSDNFI